jgi:hypothetical protein
MMYRKSYVLASLLSASVASLSTMTAAAENKQSDAIAIHLICESYGRTKSCPEFITGFIEENAYLRSAPRSDAQLVMFISTSRVGADDQLHFRVVSTIAKTPPSLELDAKIATRGTDDEIRAALAPAFHRAVALYIASAHPEAVTVEFTAVKPTESKALAELSPWGYQLNFDGGGSRSPRYASYNGFANGSISRTTARSIARVSISGSYPSVRCFPRFVCGAALE